MNARIKRRTLLGNAVGAGIAVVGLPSLLSACGGDDDADAADPPTTDGTTTSADSSAATTTVADEEVPDRGPLDFRLSYTPGVAFSGTFLAIETGAYARAGFSDVNVIPGGPNATPSPVDVATGMALVGVASTPDQVAAARINGDAPVKIIGALYQRNPYCVTSLAADPILTPEDMIGKTIGVQAVNETVWSAFLTAAGIDPGDVTTVPVQWDPTPLTAGEVDGWFSFRTNEPITLAAAGHDVEVMLLADHGYPLVAQVYIAHESTIAERRDDLVAVLGAEIQGWIASLSDPEAGPQLVISDYAPDAGLDLDVQIEVSHTQNGLILSEATRADGIMTMSSDLVEGNLATLALSGLEITADELFDLSLLEDVYAAEPALLEAIAALDPS